MCVWRGGRFFQEVVRAWTRQRPCGTPGATYPPGIWEHPSGKEVLRTLAMQAAKVGDRDKVLFLVNEVGVPVNALPALMVPDATERDKLTASELILISSLPI